MSTRDKIREMAAGVKPTAEPKVTAPASDATNGKAEPKAPRAKAAPKVAQDCKCAVPDVPGTNGGCAGGKTKGVFAPGHDAKLTGYLTREVVAGNLTAEQAVEDLKTKGGSALLQGKLKAAISRETDKAARKAKAEKERADAKAEKEAKMQLARDEAAKVKADNAEKAKQDA